MGCVCFKRALLGASFLFFSHSRAILKLKKVKLLRKVPSDNLAGHKLIIIMKKNTWEVAEPNKKLRDNSGIISTHYIMLLESVCHVKVRTD